MTEYKERHKAGGGEVIYRVNSDKGGQEKGSSNLGLMCSVSFIPFRS